MKYSGAEGGGELLAERMADMASGESDALFRFIDEFRPDLTTSVRSTLGSLGRSDVTAKPADLEFLVLSAALVLFDRADRWCSGGAPPWIWAARAIRAEIVQWLGHPRVEFVADRHARTVGGAVAAPADVRLDELAERHDGVAMWLAAVRDVAGERDRSVHLEYQTQKSLGDPSPANTVAAQFGLTPANVRQIDARIRRRLRACGIDLHASA